MDIKEIKSKMVIKEIDKGVAVEFIHLYHYSKILPRITKVYLGFYVDDKLLGVVTLGWGTQPLQTIKKIFYLDNLTSSDYFEIGKMCFIPEMNGTGDFGSLTMSMLVKWMKANTSCKFLYTLADGIMGKCGYVYQASNFRYIGSFHTQVYQVRETGEKIHPRTAKELLDENAKFLNTEKVFWLSHDFCESKGIDFIKGLMFRYIYPLNKDAEKILSKYDEYKGLKRPKDADLVFYKRTKKAKFVEFEQPNFNMNVFEYNYQKY